MRRLMFFTIGFTLACILGVWVLPANFVIPAAVIAAFLAVPMLKFGFRRISVIIFGCAVGLLWFRGFEQVYLNPARAMDGVTIETTVTATDYAFDTDYGVGVDGEFALDGKTYKIRLYVNEDVEIQPGDAIEGKFKLRYTAPGGLQDETYHAGNGTLFLGYPRGTTEVRKGAEYSLHDLGSRLHYAIAELLRDVFPADVETFARALLLGDDHDLDYDTDTALKVSGIRHVVAVSGLHVAILYTMLRAISLNRRFFTALIGFPALLLFCAVAGFTPSVTRACIMVALMILAQLMNQEYDSPTALAFAALVMLAAFPLVITSVSFQMSFLCVVGILLFDAPISAWLQAKLGVPKGKTIKSKLKRCFISSVSVSLSAIILTTPLSAFYFGTVSLVGVLTNLMTLWAVSLAFYGIAATAVLGFVSGKIAGAVAFVTAIPMRYVLRMAKLLAGFPLAALHTKSVYMIIWFIFMYILLMVFCVSRNRRPLVFFCCAVLSLCMALLISWNEHRLSDTHFTALDVGQGQCLILHQDGKTFLIDCGGDNDEIAANTAAETLLSRGISHLDGIILTHGDRDHAGGIPYLLTRVDADFLMLPATTAPELVSQITAGWSGEVILVESDLSLALERGNITVFGPTFSPNSNENSLCILFESKNCAILVTGDRGALGEMLLMHHTSLPDVDLLVAGHHGSKHSTSEELLNTIRPETVFISVGENAYGHPAQSILDRLAAFGCEVFRTDLHGNLIFRR